VTSTLTSLGSDFPGTADSSRYVLEVRKKGPIVQLLDYHPAERISILFFSSKAPYQYQLNLALEPDSSVSFDVDSLSLLLSSDEKATQFKQHLNSDGSDLIQVIQFLLSLQ
jgi:hypothetical protein